MTSASRPTGRPALADRHPRTVAVAAGVFGAAVAVPAGGPVAGAAAAVYATLAALALLRRRRTRRVDEATARALDAVAVLAADLRAGVAPGGALSAALPAFAASDAAPVARLVERLASAWEVAEAAGSPLADLLERLEADVRWLDRIRGHAAAEASGAGATAWLLAALPVAGIGVGYGMGADPLHILFRTPVGGVCAGLALLLQVAGLAWSGRLARSIAGVAG
ncbi:type II secretion system F family protein [Rugosimonospora acidiphila]|uniref:type II secretion system F family protein n=1 Tax=Rugosimonospora acidiphila TaxID=556531 RepID=UPI0031E786BD